MILEFITFYLMFWWVMSILYKGNFIFSKLSDLSIFFGQTNLVGNFFLDLSECKFCIENHTATILAIGYYSYCLDYKVLIWGFLCASINSWLRTFTE